MLKAASRGRDHSPLRDRFCREGEEAWFLTFEYLSPGSVADDISCIVAKGPRETMEEALDFRATELPAADIGQPVKRPALH